MSWRERIGGRPAEDTSFAASSSQQDGIDSEAAEMFGVGPGAVHPCWQPVTLPSGLHIFENRYTGSEPSQSCICALAGSQHTTGKQLHLLSALENAMACSTADKAFHMAANS